MQVEPTPHPPPYREVKEQVASCILSLHALKHMKGPYLQEIASHFPLELPAYGITPYGGVDIKDTEKERRKY